MKKTLIMGVLAAVLSAGAAITGASAAPLTPVTGGSTSSSIVESVHSDGYGYGHGYRRDRHHHHYGHNHHRRWGHRHWRPRMFGYMRHRHHHGHRHYHHDRRHYH
jgi:hypothetical protein